MARSPALTAPATSAAGLSPIIQTETGQPAPLQRQPERLRVRFLIAGRSRVHDHAEVAAESEAGEDLRQFGHVIREQNVPPAKVGKRHEGRRRVREELPARRFDVVGPDPAGCGGSGRSGDAESAHRSGQYLAEVPPPAVTVCQMRVRYLG